MLENTFKPKVVLGLIVKDGKFLLIRRRLPFLKVEWAFPGGVSHQGETEEESVIREVKEEVGLTVGVEKKLLERKHPNTLVRVAYFYCLPRGKVEAKIRETYEISEVEWVSAGEVLKRFTSDVDPKIQKFVLSFSKK